MCRDYPNAIEKFDVVDAIRQHVILVRCLSDPNFQ